MIGKPVLRRIGALIEKEIIELHNRVGRGDLSHDLYKFHCGQIDGLRKATQMIEEQLKTAENE